MRVFIIETTSPETQKSVKALMRSHGYVLSDYDVPRVFDVSNDEYQTRERHDQAVPKGLNKDLI